MHRETNLDSTNDERLYAMLIYLLSFFMPVVIPLVIWLIKKDESDYVDYHGKAYLNFMISYFIYTCVSTILFLTGLFIFFILANEFTTMLYIIIIPILLLVVVSVLVVIFTIIGAVKSYAGTRYRVPLTIHFIK